MLLYVALLHNYCFNFFTPKIVLPNTELSLFPPFIEFYSMFSHISNFSEPDVVGQLRSFSTIPVAMEKGKKVLNL